MSGPDATHDLLGNSLTDAEAKILEAYRQVKALLAHDLPPSASAGVKEAAAALWVVANDLALTTERPE